MEIRLPKIKKETPKPRAISNPLELSIRNQITLFSMRHPDCLIKAIVDERFNVSEMRKEACEVEYKPQADLKKMTTSANPIAIVHTHPIPDDLVVVVGPHA